MMMNNLENGRIYIIENEWCVKSLSKSSIKVYKIRNEDIVNLVKNRDEAKSTCFEIIDGMAKLWPTTKMAQELQNYFETTPQEQIDEDWEKSKIYDSDIKDYTLYESPELNSEIKKEKKPKIDMKDVYSKVVDLALIAGIIYLAYNNKDGWGWLTFILIIKN
jgi:hypothetical protein